MESQNPGFIQNGGGEEGGRDMKRKMQREGEEKKIKSKRGRGRENGENRISKHDVLLNVPYRHFSNLFLHTIKYAKLAV